MARYSGPVIDAHHHVWEPSLGRQPWLLPDAHIPFRYGDYEQIKRDYLPPDLRRDAGPLELVGSVSMETEWDDDDPIGEMEYTQAVSERFGLPTASVAHALLDDPQVGTVIERLAAMPRVRGVRHKPGGAPSPRGAASRPTLLEDRQWQAGFALLHRAGLSFDLQVAWWHFPEAARLAAEHEDTTIVIDHTGLPADRSPDGLAGWADALRLIARHDNVVLKISGLGLAGRPWTVADNRGIVTTAAEVFGPSRIMFASNFPVDGIVATYQEIYQGFLEITTDWSASEQRAAFAGNAARVYRLPSEVLGDPT
ncbi:amidohydrolase family protein [Curtobacterium sp. MCBD17_040]|uniref:amidohydrolase family protein n=1 Tax=Curtobacterium sp. MCBD17_040 TaxID=2175674 RepID=UPI000DA9F767|nr:amidohydrolase family protein [Curtobacterium sp. MCBD17_040]WIB63096.1 amidohydrolase family protein [Curtobacterium sp. MCBD17_040]